MPDPDSPAEAPVASRATRQVTPLKSALTTPPAGEIKTLCERCGAEMYRMHAVWRCPNCGFKTDCCGW
jgi:rubrerythrin